MSIYDSLITLDKERKNLVDEHSTKVVSRIGASTAVIDDLSQVLDAYDFMEKNIITSYLAKITSPILKKALEGTEELETARIIINTMGNATDKEEYQKFTGYTTSKKKTVPYLQDKLDGIYKKEK